MFCFLKNIIKTPLKQNRKFYLNKKIYVLNEIFYFLLRFYHILLKYILMNFKYEKQKEIIA